MKSMEFLELPHISSDLASENSNLKDFHFVIGDKEVENFIKQKEIKNYQELFEILKKPEYVKSKLNEHYSNEMEKLGIKLVITANEIANEFREVKSLETSVMNTHLTEDYDADSRKIKKWDKEDLVNKYFTLKRGILNKIEKRLDKYLEDQTYRKIDSSFWINGENIGFPENIEFRGYASWLMKEFIPSINKTFEKIDNYLENEKSEKTGKITAH